MALLVLGLWYFRPLILFFRGRKEIRHAGVTLIVSKNGRCIHRAYDTISLLSPKADQALNSDFMDNFILPEDVAEVGPRAFRGYHRIRNIHLDGVKTIGSKAFCDCINLINMNLSETLTTISEFAFYGCSSLANINLENVTTIGVDAFMGV